MKLSTLFGISAAISGALAITGTATAHPTSTAPTVHPEVILSPDQHHSNVSEVDYARHHSDRVVVSVGDTCEQPLSFGLPVYASYGQCFKSTKGEIKSMTAILDPTSVRQFLLPDPCVIVAFDGDNCSDEGTVVSNLYDFASKPGDRCHGGRRFIDGGFHSFRFVCGSDINSTWKILPPHDEEYDLPISARSFDAEHHRDHVTVAPADNLNCNSAQNRDTDTKVQGHCHSFDKPFSSLQATVKRADERSAIGGSEPCSVLVFSDKQCSRDGAEIVDLNNTPALGVCHNVTLHHGKDNAAIAGHSWKWLCGRQNIDDCLKPIAHHSKAHTSVVESATKTVTATTSLACTMTTESAHYLDVHTSVVTLKPVTHTSTSVFTKTMTQIRTKLITSVATDVSTVLHSVTKPYTTTYMVCDAEQDSQA